jgi:hypothetical protein
MDERRLATDEEARALASTLRLRILRICLGSGATNKEIAAVLGRNPASVLHHVRTLVRTGFLEPLQERAIPGGGREIPYRATLKSWRLNTPSKSRTLVQTFLEELALVPIDQVETTRLGLRLPAAQMEEFRTRLRELLNEFADRPVADDGSACSVFVALHPDPNRP